ncbi:GDSL esterase/lipase At4g10955-like [Miscanthus floridulus]|uniref:GDSL esterase/lipase At4g10955-like n=1 Tax=Miscanthus floridulus TaxID=154761 RepID=UPI00345A8E3F
MTPQKDLFDVSGPTYLAYVNWNCPHHRRSVMASLVQGVYVLERDRQCNRQGPDARAPAWWRFFHFELRQVLIDAADGSIFGAVYVFQPPLHLLDPTAAASAPHYAVAFRGTITKKGSAKRDLELDLQLVRNGLEGKSRFRAAMQAIHDTLADAAGQHGRVWLAGHSLGSAIATLGAKTLVRAGAPALPTFLFNAPFVSAPVERIGDRRLRQGIRIANSFVTAGVAAVLQRGGGGGSVHEASFAVMAAWVPNLFVNPADPISAEYVGYFDHRRKMEAIGAGAVGRLATRNSVKDLLLGIGKGGSGGGGGCEPLHLFPSAVLTVNRVPSPDFKTAHGIHQWWRPDLSLECTAHYYT